MALLFFIIILGLFSRLSFCFFQPRFKPHRWKSKTNAAGGTSMSSNYINKKKIWSLRRDAMIARFLQLISRDCIHGTLI